MRNAVGNYKIGVSVDPEQRRRNLQTASGLPIEIVGVYETELYAYGCENQAHQFYREYRLLGEWFSFDDNMISEVDDNLQLICLGKFTRKNNKKPSLKYRQFSQKEYVNPCLQSAIKRFINKPTLRDAQFLSRELEMLNDRVLPMNSLESALFTELSEFFKAAAMWSPVAADWERACRLTPKKGRIRLRSRDGHDLIERLYFYVLDGNSRF